MERAIEAFVQYYNQDRYHESLDNGPELVSSTFVDWCEEQDI